MCDTKGMKKILRENNFPVYIKEKIKDEYK